MTLPVTMLIVDIWPLKRLPFDLRYWSLPEYRRVLLEKIPYFLLAAAAAAIAVLGQKEHASSLTFAEFGIPERIAQSLYGLGFYAFKTVLPFGLSPLYERPMPFDPTEPRFLLAGALVAAGATLLWRAASRVPAAVAAAGAYCVAVLPVLGWLPVGDYLVADRYSYLASLPLTLLFGSAVAPHLSKTAQATAVCLLLSAYGTAAARQASYWTDSETLWKRALVVEPQGVTSRVNLADALQSRGEVDGAETLYREALTIDSDDSRASTELAALLLSRGEHRQAEDLLRTVLRSVPEDRPANHLLGRILASTGRGDEAAEYFSRAYENAPRFALAAAPVPAKLDRKAEARRQGLLSTVKSATDPDVLFRAGISLTGLGDRTAAMAAYRRAIDLDPRHAKAMTNLANGLVSSGRAEEALSHFRAALDLRPNEALIHFNHGNALALLGRHQDAVKAYDAALSASPGLTPAKENRASVLRMIEASK